MTLESNIVMFIKKTIIELACNNKLDHRNYDKNTYQSRLKKATVKHNYNLDLAITEIVKELIADESIMEMIKTIRKEKVDSDIIDEDVEGIEDNEDEVINEDEEYELKSGLYYEFIRFVGLNELLSLHADNNDDFQLEFEKAITR
jgi:hypothetical protein